MYDSVVSVLKPMGSPDQECLSWVLYDEGRGFKTPEMPVQKVGAISVCFAYLAPRTGVR